MWTGEKCFGGRCLHDISPDDGLNPYQQAIAIIGRTLARYDEDGLIPAYGFGDSSSGGTRVFSFMAGDLPCAGLGHALTRYEEIVPNVNLMGPTSFAPIIRQALRVVRGNRRQFTILLIVADGQVDDVAVSTQAIVDASAEPLSIICVGVGDGELLAV